MELIIVIFNRDNGIVKCKSACGRFKAYNICEHSLSVTENEGLLQIKTDFYSIWNSGGLRLSHAKGYQIFPTLANYEILVKNQQNQHQIAKERQIRIKKLI